MSLEDKVKFLAEHPPAHLNISERRGWAEAMKEISYLLKGEAK